MSLLAYAEFRLWQVFIESLSYFVGLWLRNIFNSYSDHQLVVWHVSSLMKFDLGYLSPTGHIVGLWFFSVRVSIIWKKTCLVWCRFLDFWSLGYKWFRTSSLFWVINLWTASSCLPLEVFPDCCWHKWSLYLPASSVLF